MQTMSNTMNAVSTAAGTLHNLATQAVFQDDGLPPVSNDMISTIQQYSLAFAKNRREGRGAGLSSVHCSIDSWSEHVTRGSKVDGNVNNEREGDGKCGEERQNADHSEGYREGPSWGAYTPAVTSVLDTIVERNDDDIEMDRSQISESDRSFESSQQQAFFHEQELLQEQLQQKQEQWEQEQKQKQLVQQQQLQQAIQEELARGEDRTTLMSEITAGTLRSERHQARGFLNLRLCDAL